MVIRKLFNYWISRQRDSFYVTLAVCLAVLYVAGLMLNQYDRAQLGIPMQRISFAGFLILAAVVFIHKNLNAFYEFLRLFRDTDHLPQKQISYVNSFCMTVFLIVSVIVILAMVAATEPLWKAIAAWYSGLPPVQIPPSPQQNTAGGSQDALMAHLAELAAASGPPPIWLKLLDVLLEKLGILFIIVAVFFLLQYAAKGVWSFITRPRHFDEDEKIYLKPTLSMPLDIRPPETEDTGSGGLRYLFSYNARIRRHYRKEITNGRKQRKQSGPPPQWAAPAELELLSGLDDAVLHKLYEKARYSRDECTEDDWNQIRS